MAGRSQLPAPKVPPKVKAADAVHGEALKKPMPRKQETLATKLGLSLKEAAFCEVYLQNRGNGTHAALATGFGTTEGSAATEGSRLLRIPKIMAYINQRGQELLEKLEITTDLLTAELAKMAFSNVKDFMTWDEQGYPVFRPSDELSDVATAAIAEITFVDTKHGRNVKFKMHDKKGALDSLAKLKGFMVEKHAVDHTSGGKSLLDLANQYGMQSAKEDE